MRISDWSSDVCSSDLQGVNDTSPPERVKIEAAIARSVDTVVATRQEEVFELIRMGVWRRRVVLVPCGVDTARFTPAGPREPRRSEERRVGKECVRNV